MHKTNEPLVQITLTIGQAYAVADALEMYSRLALGQIEHIAEAVRDGFIPINKDSQAARRTSETFAKVDDACALLKGDLGFLPGASYGIGNRQVSTQAHRAYEIKKVLERELALQVNPNPAFRGVHYDGLTIRYTDDPAPECVILPPQKEGKSSGY